MELRTKLKSKALGWAGEMAQGFRVHTALAEEPTSIPRSHTKQLTTTVTAAPEGLMPLASMGPCTYRHAHIIRILCLGCTENVRLETAEN